MDKYLGKISKAEMGFGGYQDIMFGLRLDFKYGDVFGTSEFIPIRNTSSSVRETNDDCLDEIIKIFKESKSKDVNKLVGKPVELTFDGTVMKEWRILKEVL